MLHFIMQGYPGRNGEPGRNGSIGDPGMPGTRGFRGDMGAQGPTVSNKFYSSGLPCYWFDFMRTFSR